MFGFSYAKLILIGAVVLTIGGMYGYIHVLKGERDSALKEVGALTTAKAVQDNTIEVQKQAITQWKDQAAAFQKTLDRMAQNQIAANETARKLNDVLSRHDLHALSLAKPGRIERRINSGTADVFRMLRNSSGASDHN